MTVAILLAVLFAALGVVFLLGKGGFLIAGYNTATDEEKARYDEKRLNRCFAAFSFGISATVGLTAYVDTEEFALKAGLPLILILVAFLAVATAACKRR